MLGEGGRNLVQNLKKSNFKDGAVFVALNTISFLSFKQIFDAVTALDDKPTDFKAFQSSLGLFNFV